MPTGYVALLDVLGFSSLVADTDKNSRLEQYLQCLEEALDPTDAVVRYVVFSDTIVLTTENNLDASFRKLVARCSALFGLMLRKDIALRGAIAHGSFFRRSNVGGVFIAGRAVVDAYTFETKQDWVGIMLTPSSVKQNPTLKDKLRLDAPWNAEGAQVLRSNLDLASFLQPCYSIPFHAENSLERNDFQGFAIVPSSGQAGIQAFSEHLDESLRALEWLKSLAPDPTAQAKYLKCMSWLNQIRSQYHNAERLLEQFPMLNGRVHR